MRFVGIDLSWNMKPLPGRTAVAILDEAKRLLFLKSLTSDAQVVKVIQEHRQEGCLVGLDAPLVVPNERGSRRCERELQRRRCPVYAANRTWITKKYGGLRGERLVRKLERLTPPVRLVDAIRPHVPYHAVLEVYPHASYTMLFGYSHTALYKHGTIQNRAQAIIALTRRIFEDLDIEMVPDKRAEITPTPEMKCLSDILSRASCQCRSTVSECTTFKNNNPPRPMTASQIDRISDWLDAIVSAYTLWQYWMYGDIRSEIVGTLHEGFILIPSTPAKQMKFF